MVNSKNSGKVSDDPKVVVIDPAADQADKNQTENEQTATEETIEAIKVACVALQPMAKKLYTAGKTLDQGFKDLSVLGFELIQLERKRATEMGLTTFTYDQKALVADFKLAAKYVAPSNKDKDTMEKVDQAGSKKVSQTFTNILNTAAKGAFLLDDGKNWDMYWVGGSKDRTPTTVRDTAILDYATATAEGCELLGVSKFVRPTIKVSGVDYVNNSTLPVNFNRKDMETAFKTRFGTGREAEQQQEEQGTEPGIEGEANKVIEALESGKLANEHVETIAQAIPVDRLIGLFVADPALFTEVVTGVFDAIAKLKKPEADQIAAITAVKESIAA